MYAGLVMLGLIAVMVAPGFAIKARFADETGEVDVDTLARVMALGGFVLMGLVAYGLLRHHPEGACMAMAVPALRIRELYPYCHRTPARDDEAPYGWTMTLYRTSPVRNEHGIGIESTALDTAWFPTCGVCRDVANHVAWKLNGERVPSSSFGWTGKVDSPDGAWRYGFSVHGEDLFYGYACEWRAVTPSDRLYGVDLGPIIDHARDYLYEWSGDTRADVDRIPYEMLSREIGQTMGIGEPYHPATLYRDHLAEEAMRAEEGID
jgi:hypothetical protein